MVATTTSDSMGDYSFTIAQPGTYVIVETQQAGWTLTQPTSIVYTETVTSGANLTGLDFGNFQLVSVSGNVYNDKNGNGNQDPGDPGLQNWTVEVLDSGGNVVASALSDANGNYTITGVGPGSFTLNEVVQTGWTITQPTNPSYYSFTTSSGVNVVGGIFGNFQTITVSGNVYNDLDGNGLKTAGEPGLQGWTLNLLDSSGNVLATQTSDASGNYTFTGVGPGKLSLAEVVQTNWVQTQPLYPTVYSFTGQGGHNLTALNFGDHASPALSPVQVIDNGQPGYSETGTWSTAIGGFNGTNRVAQTSHGSGSNGHGLVDLHGAEPGLRLRRLCDVRQPRAPTRRRHRSRCTTAAPAWARSSSTSRSWSPRLRAVATRAPTVASAGWS